MTARKSMALDKKQLWRDIGRDEKRKAREHLRELRHRLREARGRRTQALIEAKERCRAGRLAARERVLAMRERVLRELREAMQAEHTAARETCARRLSDARAIQDDVARSRAELLAERQYRVDLRRIQRANRQRLKEAPSATRAERLSESDDEVRSSIPVELVPLFEKIKRTIKASPRMSRAERFLHWAEEHPADVLQALEDKTDSLVRELEQREHAAERALRRRPRAHQAAAREQAPF